MTSSKKQKVFVVEDHPIFKQGLIELINRDDGLSVCGDAVSVTDALPLVEKAKPDVILLDLSLQNSNGLELVKELRGKNDATKVLVLSMHSEDVYAERALRAGANGYVMKQAPVEEVVSALHHVLKGEIYLSKNMTSKIINQSVGHNSPPAAPVQRLTDRELEVFQLIGQGLSTSEIAKSLGLSVKTVDTHRAHIMSKLGVRNVNELIHNAVHWRVSEAGR